MKFLVILISLIINYLWLKDFDRFDDAWFFRFRKRMEEAVASIDAGQLRWIAGLGLIYGIPLVSLGLLLWFIDGIALGLPTMLVHILVLLIAFDRTQPGQMAKEFLQYWQAGDQDACIEHLKETLCGNSRHWDPDKSLSEQFSELFVYRFFERMFVMFFWYMLAGPLGILFAYVSYQLRDSHQQDQNAEEVSFIELLIAILEWLPVRLLALTFSLAGNFVRCFESFKAALWTFDRQANTAEMLYAYARCALSGVIGLVEPDPEAEETAEELERRQQAREMEALVALMERSQAIWLVLLALLTIFAL